MVVFVVDLLVLLVFLVCCLLFGVDVGDCVLRLVVVVLAAVRCVVCDCCFCRVVALEDLVLVGDGIALVSSSESLAVLLLVALSGVTTADDKEEEGETLSWLSSLWLVLSSFSLMLLLFSPLLLSYDKARLTLLRVLMLCFHVSVTTSAIGSSFGDLENGCWERCDSNTPITGTKLVLVLLKHNL